MDSRDDLQQRILSALNGRPSSPTIQEWSEGRKRLSVELRSDGDIQVEFHIAEEHGTDGEEKPASENIAAFVEKILDERIVLVMDGHFFRGGQQWVSPERIPASSKVDFVRSWCGTYDR